MNATVSEQARGIPGIIAQLPLAVTTGGGAAPYLTSGSHPASTAANEASSEAPTSIALIRVIGFIVARKSKRLGSLALFQELRRKCRCWQEL